MRFDQVLEALAGQAIHRSHHWDHFEVRHVIAGDLMSDVLVTEIDEVLLVTSLPSDQAARTAGMVGACGIVLVNAKKPQDTLVSLCAELNLSLILTDLGCFETCFRLGQRLFARP